MLSQRVRMRQVQAAIRESRGGAWSRASSAAPAVLQSGSGTPPAAHASTPHVFHNGRATPSENGQMANGGLSNGGSTPLLAEGTETALLYVRFRAVAEPGLKGALQDCAPCSHVHVQLEARPAAHVCAARQLCPARPPASSMDPPGSHRHENYRGSKQESTVAVLAANSLHACPVRPCLQACCTA